MKQGDSVFDIWGGVRKMARDIRRAPSTVHGWKKEGRVPANEQHHVLAIAEELGLPITAEHVVFPLGREAASVPTDLAASPVAVACDRKAGLQRKDIR